MDEKSITRRHPSILHCPHHTSCQHTSYSSPRPKFFVKKVEKYTGNENTSLYHQRMHNFSHFSLEMRHCSKNLAQDRIVCQRLIQVVFYVTRCHFNEGASFIFFTKCARGQFSRRSRSILGLTNVTTLLPQSLSFHSPFSLTARTFVPGF